MPHYCRKICGQCEQTFIGPNGRCKRCPDCCKCEWCGKQLNKRQKHIRFCNLSCAGKYNTRHSEKIQASHRKARENSKGPRLHKRGVLHHNWKGGADNTHRKAMKRSEYKQWRLEVFKRDNFTCICGYQGKALQAHHFFSWAEYPELRYIIFNGITLCKSCHNKVHPELNFIGGGLKSV